MFTSRILQMTAHLDIFNDQLLKGFTLAESAYMATRALSWMTVVVGDPLYRPYASWLQIDRRKSDGAKPGATGRCITILRLKNAEEEPAEYFATGAPRSLSLGQRTDDRRSRVDAKRRRAISRAQ